LNQKKRYCLKCKESLFSCNELFHIKFNKEHLIIDDDEKDYFFSFEYNNVKINLFPMVKQDERIYASYVGIIIKLIK